MAWAPAYGRGGDGGQARPDVSTLSQPLLPRPVAAGSCREGDENLSQERFLGRVQPALYRITQTQAQRRSPSVKDGTPNRRATPK